MKLATRKLATEVSYIGLGSLEFRYIYIYIENNLDGWNYTKSAIAQVVEFLVIYSILFYS